ncbi:BTAD domain-containing putative transcriptional regulator [Kitasatospora sp. NPDC052896]|uniref:BTAD domain-containing putative transcriptional regulator n=1 Tax=Kitasatospora sp. NPDC052896 TaxID=3364061 RepID=UPI0037C6A672
MRFSLLGPLTVHDGTSARTLDGPKARVLLGVLLLNPNQPVSTDCLQEALWGEHPPATASASLKNHIARLRRALTEDSDDEPRIRAVRGGYTLRVGPGELDTDDFTSALATARTAYHRKDWPTVNRETKRAAALWRSTPMPELADLTAAQPHVERYTQARWQALEWRIDAELALGRHQGLAPELTGLIAEQPLREAFHRQLMLVLHRTGQQAEALAVFGRLRRTLIDELGVEPGASVLAAHQEILRPTTTPTPTSPPHAPGDEPDRDGAGDAAPDASGPAPIGGVSKSPAPPAGPVPAPAGSGVLPSRGDLAEVAESLARNVHSRWLREEEQRRIHDPFPLPVRWRSAPAGLLDHWDNISGAAPGATAGALSLDGGLAQITDVYRRVGSGRLVVLGRAGSGKTVLMMRFVLDYLETRGGGEPVPVVFSIGSWDPTVTALRDWLVDRLLRDHPNLAAPASSRSTQAAALVDAGWILPVLEGFDEIATGLQAAALRELNSVSLPLLLTSRTEQFADAAATGVLGKAAGIELTDLTTDDLIHYLPRTARPTAPGKRTGRAATVWCPVLDELRNRPDHQAGANLAAVLSTPLMVLLARTLYSDTPGQDPADLLDTTRFPTPQALEEHLLAGFVPTVYRQRPPAGLSTAASRPHRVWDPHHARHYLGHLAAHLDRPEQRHRQDLAWWHLSGALSLPSRILAIVLASTAATTLSLLVSATMGLVMPSRWTTFGLTILPAGLTVGPVVGLAFGLVHAVAVTFDKEAFEPSRVRLQLPGRGRRMGDVPARRLNTAWGAGLLVGLIVGLAYGPTQLVLGMSRKSRLANAPLVEAVLAHSLLYAVIFGMAGGLALGLMATLETPLDVGSAATPMDLLAINRSTVIRQALLVAPVITVAIAIFCRVLGATDLFQGWFGPSPSLWTWLGLGTDCGLIGTLCYVLSFTAWGQWVLFTRIWLPLTGRLPWSPMAFLDDAYHRGVLRQAGAVYQFRHARLQSHLSPTPYEPKHG